MGSVGRWAMLADGPCWQKGHVMADGPCWQMGHVGRWAMLADGPCWHPYSDMAFWSLECLPICCTASICVQHFTLNVWHPYLHFLFAGRGEVVCLELWVRVDDAERPRRLLLRHLTGPVDTETQAKERSDCLWATQRWQIAQTLCIIADTFLNITKKTKSYHAVEVKIKVLYI